MKSLGVAEYARQVEAEFVHIKDGTSTLTQAEIDRVAGRFNAPVLPDLPAEDAGYAAQLAGNKAFANWVKRNVRAHKAQGYVSVMLSLKKTGVAPGDITVDQFDAVADQYAFDEVRSMHEQNLVSPA